MNARLIIESKLFVFTSQLILLSILINVFKYEFRINFDAGISSERVLIIQILANLVMYDFFSDLNSKSLMFFYFWAITALIPVIIYKNPRIAVMRNFTALFFPNFFLYIFLSRYSPNYYSQNFNGLILRTMFLTAYIFIISVIFSMIYKFIIKDKKEDLEINMNLLEKKVEMICPHCGTKFNSIPLICYNCSKEIFNEKEKE